MIFDTHIHLNDPAFQDYEKAIKEARENNVKKMVIVGYDLSSSKLAVKIANQYSFVYAAVGIHPSESLKEYDQDLKEMESLIDKKVVAVGEIGLDYHYPDYDKQRQKDLFVKQLEIAKKYNLPIIIHSRDASHDTHVILQEYKHLYKKGIMHCYAYSKEMSKEFAKLGFVFGIGGVVTYKNAKEIKEVVQFLDEKNIVLETDAPYLAPTPHRGEINKAPYINYVAQEIANLKEMDIKSLEEITYKNACDFFGVSYED